MFHKAIVCLELPFYYQLDFFSKLWSAENEWPKDDVAAQACESTFFRKIKFFESTSQTITSDDIDDLSLLSTEP